MLRRQHCLGVEVIEFVRAWVRLTILYFFITGSGAVEGTHPGPGLSTNLVRLRAGHKIRPSQHVTLFA